MLLVYCDKCGRRVPEATVSEGRALKVGENRWICETCTPPAPNVSTHTTKSASPVGGNARRGTAVMTKSGAIPAPVPSGGSSRKLVVGVLISGICMLVAAIVIILVGRSNASKRALAAASTPPLVSKDVKEKEKPRPPDVAVVTPPTTTGIITPPTPAPAPADPPAEGAPISKSDRAKKADKEMEEFRNQRGMKVLEELQAWFKQNPTEEYAYQTKLRDLSTSYSSAPAGIEAKRMLSEMKIIPPPPPPPDRLEEIAESKQFQLVYDLNLARISSHIPYTVDNRSKITQPFDRIAYYMELQLANGETQFIYVSMDAFTTEPGKIGVPTAASGAQFQMNVASMNIVSNVNGIIAGTAMTGGNIEFWPCNYGPQNGTKIPNASAQTYDFGDQTAGAGEGHGSMQVHNHEAKQTLFALNNWRSGSGAEIGIGNNANGNPDWTFSKSSYRSKRLRVLVHLK